MRILGILLAGALTLSAQSTAADAKVRQWMRAMTLRQKVAQLVVVPFYGDLPNTASREYRQHVRHVRDNQVGGLIILNRVRERAMRRGEPFATAAFLNRMQRLAKLPLLVGGDFERGASMRINSTTLFPHAMAFAAARDPKTGAKDLDATRFLGEQTAREARAMGFHWVMFPVADVNVNPDNPIINIRSFGENPVEVGAHVRAFIEGTRYKPRDPFTRVLTTAKHFPGQGDTSTDTHINIASVPSDRTRLDAVELAPFREAIAAGVDIVMTAHLAVPALEQPDIPATLSPAILTNLLRGDLNFKGIVSTDALEMGGVAKGYGAGEAAVKAIEAGADVLLIPPDPDAAINAVVVAVREKRIPLARIDASVRRILGAKIRMGLDRKRLVDVEAVEDIVESPAAMAQAQQAADRAVTVVRNEGQLPLKPGSGVCVAVLTENRYSVQGFQLTEHLKQLDPKARVEVLDPLMSESDVADVSKAFTGCRQLVAAAFVAANAYRGLALPGGYVNFLESWLAGPTPVTLIALGNPYLIRSFPGVKAYVTTYSPAPTAEGAAAKAIYGAIPTVGRLPVTIPGFAKAGDGLQ